MTYNFLRFPGGKPKALTLSYDDGSSSDMRLANTLNKYDIKCTFNLVGSRVAQEKGLTKEFIKAEILDKGHEIANHGYFHRALDCVRPIEGIRETIDTRLTLEKEFGIIVRGMAFPDRSVNKFKSPVAYESIKSYLKELDIAYVRTAGDDNNRFELPEDFHNWMPSAHHNNPHIMEYIDEFIGLNLDSLYKSRRNAKLFYLWGHAHEYEKAQNWELLESICEKLSGKEDIWYATNMEIYDYVSAFNSLIYSADATIVYNPTLLEIWFDTDGVLRHIKPGETITLD